MRVRRTGLHFSLSAKSGFYLLHLRSPVHVVPPLRYRERKEVGHWRRWGDKTTSKKQRPLPVQCPNTIALRGKVMRAPEINGREEYWNSKLDFGRGMFIEGGAVRTIYRKEVF
jgi:hypothetical protein